MNALILRERLHYDPETGFFVWKIRNAARKAGDRAGCFAKGYIKIGVCGKTYQAANLAWLYMAGKFPTCWIDHINGDGTDNRFSNLREIDRSGNAKNMRVRPNLTGCTGISWDRPYKRFKVRISVNKRRIFVGHSKSLPEAIRMRKAAEKQHGYTERHGMKICPTE